MLLMEKRKHLFWSPCATHCIDLMLKDIGNMKHIKETLDQAKMITSFIYNSLKVVNLMKVFTKDIDILCPGIIQFATEFISLQSLICYEGDLKMMCTTNEWCEFNKDRSGKSLRDKVSNLILTDRFWKKAKEVQIIMEPLVKVLKLVDQDKKPTLSIIYEAMDRAKLTIKASVKHWERSRIKISVNTDISVIGFYGNIENIGHSHLTFTSAQPIAVVIKVQLATTASTIIALNVDVQAPLKLIASNYFL